MSNVDGILGGGIRLKLTNGAGALIEVLGLVTCNPPAPTVATVDSTDQSSQAVEEFIAGRITPGDLSGTIKYVPGNADDDLFREHLFSRKKRPFEIFQPSEDGQPGQNSTGVAIMTAFTPNDGATDGIRTSSFTLKISGLPSQSDAPAA